MNIHRRLPRMCYESEQKEGEKMKKHPKLVSATVTESKPVPIVNAIKKTENRDPPSKTKIPHKQNSRTMRKEKTLYYRKGKGAML
ncbi:hypothetical protein ACTXT7_015743 [Hymenolepis weldensis]